jgi:Chalcone isomerase-like
MTQRPVTIKNIAVRAIFIGAYGLFGLSSSAWAQASTYENERADAARFGLQAGNAKPEVLARLPEANFSGKGLLRFLGFDVYTASLWVAPPFKYSELGQHAVALELEYLRKFRRQEIARVSLEQMRLSGGFSAEQGQQWQTALANTLPDVKPGDRLLGVYRPGASVLFALNGQFIGEIADAQFAKLFFDIWLGPKSSSPKLREQLLAGAPR